MRQLLYVVLAGLCTGFLAGESQAKSYRFCGFSQKASVTKIRCSAKRLDNLKGLRPFKELRELNLTRSGLTSVRSIPSLASLRVVSLNYAPIASLDGLGANPTIEELDASNTAIRHLRGVEALPFMRILTLWNAKVSNVGPLAKLTKLESLVLGGSLVQDLSPLAGLKSLRLLNLERTPIQSLESLQALPALKTVFLGGTSLTRVELRKFRAKRPDVGIVGCDGKSPTPCVLIRTPMPTLCTRLITCCTDLRRGSNGLVKECEAVASTLEKVSYGKGDSSQLMTRICRHTLRDFRKTLGKKVPASCPSVP